MTYVQAFILVAWQQWVSYKVDIYRKYNEQIYGNTTYAAVGWQWVSYMPVAKVGVYNVQELGD